MDTGGHVVASVAAEPAPPVVSVVAIEEADPLLSEAYPVSLVEISGTHALDLKDINLPATVNDADGEGNCVVSFTVPAKYRHGTSLYLPVSLSPSFAPVSTALVTDTSSSDTEVQGVDDADAAAATGENMIRLLRTANGIHTLDMPGFQAVGYLPPPVQASPVSVLTEPLSHSVGPGRSLSFTNVLGENKVRCQSFVTLYWFHTDVICVTSTRVSFFVCFQSSGIHVTFVVVYSARNCNASGFSLHQVFFSSGFSIFYSFLFLFCLPVPISPSFCSSRIRQRVLVALR